MSFLTLFSAGTAYAGLDEFIANVNGTIINPLIEFMFAVAILFFLYGVLEFLFNQQNEEKKTSGKSHMLWGVVGIVIMMGVWGILNLIINTLDIKGIDPEQGTVELSP